MSPLSKLLKRSFGSSPAARRSRRASGRRLLLEPLESRVVLSVAPAVDYVVGAEPQAAAVGDFNGDGFADVITANRTSGDVSILLGNGDGSLGPSVSFAADAGSHAVAVGDFDQDPAEGLD